MTAIGLGLALWLAATAVLARSGVLSHWQTIPPRFPIVPLTGLAVVVFLHSRAATARLLTAISRPWPIALQSFRILVELSLWRLYSEGNAPALITFEGRNFDVLVGLTAPLVAFGIWKWGLPARAVVLWNFLGLAILANTVFTVVTSLPGPLRRDWPGAPFTAIADWPFIWIPALLVPLAVFLHVFSIRQYSGPRRARGF